MSKFLKKKFLIFLLISFAIGLVSIYFYLQRETKDQNLQRIYNFINKYIQDLLYCLKDPEISPDNNLAERALRPLVIQRKIMGGNRSPQGAQTQEVNLSVIETLRMEGQNLFSAMKQLVLNYLTSNE